MLEKLKRRILFRYCNSNEYLNLLREIGVSIGENCEISKDVVFGSEPYLISIGNHVRITGGVKFVTHDGGVWVLRDILKNEKIDLFGKIKIGNNVHIGMNAIIMSGVKIGDNVIVGAGAIVTKDIPSNQIWAGIPAKCIKTIEQYYEQHLEDFDYTKHMNYLEKKSYLLKKFEAHNEK